MTTRLINALIDMVAREKRVLKRRETFKRARETDYISTVMKGKKAKHTIFFAQHFLWGGGEGTMIAKKYWGVG